MSKHTPGPWVIEPLKGKYYGTNIRVGDGLLVVWGPCGDGISLREKAACGESCAYPDCDCISDGHYESGTDYANARLIAAAPDMYSEMLRYLPVLERAEANCELWARLTEGLGIATLNGYRAAIAKAESKQ